MTHLVEKTKHWNWLKCSKCFRVYQWTTASFDLPPEGSAKKEKKLDSFEHNHIFWFKLQCASIVVLLCTAIWWKSKDAVVHCRSQDILLHGWVMEVSHSSNYSSLVDRSRSTPLLHPSSLQSGETNFDWAQDLQRVAKDKKRPRCRYANSYACKTSVRRR